MDEEQRLNLEDIVDESTEAEASILMLRAAVRLLPYLHPDFPDYLKLGLDEWRITKRQEPFILSLLRALQLSYVLFHQPESVSFESIDEFRSESIANFYNNSKTLPLPRWLDILWVIEHTLAYFDPHENSKARDLSVEVLLEACRHDVEKSSYWELLNDDENLSEENHLKIIVSKLYNHPDFNDDPVDSWRSPFEVVGFAEALHQSGSEWSFWDDFYAALVLGKGLDFELHRRIANLSSKEWRKGPAHIAAKIEDIKASYLAEKLPVAETVEINPDTGNFRAVPIPVQNLPLMGALLSRVRDAVEDAVQGNNGLNERAREVRVLTRSVERYGNDPQRIEMDFTSVAIGLRRQFETQDLPQSEDNLALLEAVEESVRGIRATHPDVAENRLVLAQQAWREMAPADKVLLAEAQPILVAISEGALAEDFAADIPALINDAIGPPTKFAPLLPGADEATRIFGRVAKMAPLAVKLLDTGAKWHDSRVHKSAKLGLTVVSVTGLLGYLVQLGLRLLGVV